MNTTSVANATDRRAIDSGPPGSCERRKGGRPRIGDPVLIRFGDDLMDDLNREALKRDVPTSQVIRERCGARRFRAA